VEGLAEEKVNKLEHEDTVIEMIENEKMKHRKFLRNEEAM
jgi:hypothetical protein